MTTPTSNETRLRSELQFIVRGTSTPEGRRIIVDTAVKIAVNNPRWPLVRVVLTARKALNDKGVGV